MPISNFFEFHLIRLLLLAFEPMTNNSVRIQPKLCASRHQVVRINSTLSDRMQVRNGVPQVSILGLLLFSINVNDLSSIPQYCSPQFYVDDTKLLLSFALHEERGVRDKINQNLLKIRNWCFNNQLLLNPDKTKLLIFGGRQNIAKVAKILRLSQNYTKTNSATLYKNLPTSFCVCLVS